MHSRRFVALHSKNNKLKKQLNLLLHPYLFVLQEGKDIKEDFLDYSLMILQVGHAEILPSPKKEEKATLV